MAGNTRTKRKKGAKRNAGWIGETTPKKARKGPISDKNNALKRLNRILEQRKLTQPEEDRERFERSNYRLRYRTIKMSMNQSSRIGPGSSRCYH